jgi:hypothetical protein
LDVYLKDESKNYTLQFPVNPLDKLSNPKEKKYITADIIDFGEVDISQKGSKIREVSFNSLFPKEYDSYCRYVPNMLPIDYVNTIQFWIDADVPVRLIITDLNINELVNISKFETEVRGGEVDAIYFSITFRTYRELKIEPGTDNNIIGVAYNGEQLIIFRQYGNWADTYWGNHGGFVCLDYVTKV